MDRDFPSVLFPSLYNNEPPDTALGHCAGSWGSYGHLRPATPQTFGSAHTFKAQHEARGEVWYHMEPVPVPLFSPKHAKLWSSKPSGPQDFSLQLQNFFLDYPLDAFSSVARLLGHTFCFGQRREKKVQKQHSYKNMKKMSCLTDKLKYQTCPETLASACVDNYCRLLSDAVHSVPEELLASLLHEELGLQNLNGTFCEDNTGGALDLIPFTSSPEAAPQSGCLVYCANGVDKLSFQQVALQPNTVLCSGEASTFLLKGPVQQISSSSTCGHSCVAVRSMYHCGVWDVSSSQPPHPLEAMSSPERLCSICVSPHVAGELVMANDSGAARLWRLGHGMQLVRTEDSNLYFKVKSSWRWCEFTAHPRVMLYADRTGAELTDIRVQPSLYHTLFRISRAAECRSGERLLLCRYLSPLHSFHHLITTQYSAYIMDERFPCVPMLKWDHMMDSPPVFCHVLPGSRFSTAKVAKVLLGSQCTQEVTVLQYSGGRTEASVSHGPLQALLRPRDSVEVLPTQIPHRTEASRTRLTHPVTGLTAVQLKRTASEESFCIFQLLQTGDVIYQILEKAASVNEPLTDGSEQQAQPPTSRCVELELTQESTFIWKQWLQKLSRSNEVNASGNVAAKGRLDVVKAKTQSSRCLQRDLKKSMCNHFVPVGSTAEVEPLRLEVQAEEWADDVSSRLTAGWDSEAVWQCWWADHLGVSTTEKTQTLQRKRLKLKEAKRARGLSLLAMSSSFTSSISYQSELSDLSDRSWSDTAGTMSQPENSSPKKTPGKPSVTEGRVKTFTLPSAMLELEKTCTPLPETEEMMKTHPPPAATLEMCNVKPVDMLIRERRAGQWQSEASNALDHPSTQYSSELSPSLLSPVAPKCVASSLGALNQSQSSQRHSQRLSQASQPRKKSRMGF